MTIKINSSTILSGHCIDRLRELPDASVNCVVTSPPYWGLRDYGLPPVRWDEVHYSPMPGLPGVAIPEWTGCLGLEPTPEMYVGHMVQVFREVRRVLRDDGTLWLNLGDSYATKTYVRDKTFGNPEFNDNRPSREYTKIPSRDIPIGLKQKDLVGIPWRVAFALQADGWYLRSDIVWHKPNAMPESVRDRPTKSHEYIFLLTKSERYYYDHESIKENAVSTHPSGNGFKRPQRLSYGGRGNEEQWKPTEKRNRRTVWTVPTRPFKGAHFAVFPPDLIEPCILAGCPEGGVVLDPFGGSGTTTKVALQYRRECVLIEQNPDYVKEAEKRTATIQPLIL